MHIVSMESGLEDRNNRGGRRGVAADQGVSMESGLEDRNNAAESEGVGLWHVGLNGVRPRRPEQ